MRAGLVIVALAGCSAESSGSGRLVCKADGKTFEARVPKNGLAAVRERAEQAQLTDCRFEPGKPLIAHWPEHVPVAIAPPPPPPPDPYDLPGGGVVGGVLGSPPPPPPPPMPPMNVPPATLENNRIAGDKVILPNVDTQLEIQRAGKDKVIGSFKLCVTALGEVQAVSQLKSTGFAEYDAKIMREIRSWKYLPYIYNGKETPVCTAVTYIWSVP